MSKTLTLKPRVSEKSYGLSLLRNTFVIAVPADANKVSVKQAVEAQYNVTVTNVRIAISKGKTKRTYRRGGRSVVGVRSDVKRAYVTLKDGDTLPVFAGVESEAKPAEETKDSSKKADKKDKSAKKEAK